MTIVEITKTAKNPEFLRWIASNFISEKEIKEALISNPATPVDTLKGIFLHDYFFEPLETYSNNKKANSADALSEIFD